MSRRECACIGLRRLLALCAAAVLLTATGSAAASCPVLPNGGEAEWIDPETTVCSVQRCTDGDLNKCLASSGQMVTMQLVFSDEFNKAGRDLSVQAGDSRWTAHKMWYDATADYEVYRPEQVTTAGGAAVITMENKTIDAPVQRIDGSVWNVTKPYVSGFFDSWNKFCFTGGYLEAELQFPGDNFHSGFWPAFWLMGNLGRAGYMKTTKGFWPYTYSQCGGGDAGLESPDAVAPQLITACGDPEGFDRTKYDFQPGVGRGAPEIDMVEVKVASSVDEHSLLGEPDMYGIQRFGPYADPQQLVPISKGGKKPEALNSMTLQVAPFLPNGTSWNNVTNVGGIDGPGPLGPGMALPGWKQAADGTWQPPSPYTHTTYWTNDGGFSYGMLKDFPANWKQFGATPDEARENFLLLMRPGSLIQDSISVFANLNESFFNMNSANKTNYHKFGLDWKPKEYVRWYIDGKLVYEVNSAALRRQDNGTYETFERQIPVEAMYIIFNFAMSNKFTKVDIDNLTFPAYYKVNYVRVYQEPSKVNLGCSPKAYPTAQWLACHRDTYIIQPEDQVLIPDKCTNFPTCQSEYGVRYEGRTLFFKNGTKAAYVNVSSPQDCCQMCGSFPECGGYTWEPLSGDGWNNTCELKSFGWERVPWEPNAPDCHLTNPPSCRGMPISGVAYDANSSVPRANMGDVTTRSISAAASISRAGRAAGCLLGALAAALLMLL
ncbi:hypothetical protein ABPG77_004385 [Micractinium sp. CCAP 211/92]